MNYAHEYIADFCSSPGFIKKRIFPVQNRSFEGLLAQIIVDRRSFDSEKQDERLPVFLHVIENLSKPGIRFDLPLIQLILHPYFQLIHHRTALVLMKLQAFVRREVFPFGQLFDMEYPDEGFCHMAAFIRPNGSSIDLFHKPSPEPARMP